jgi:hypothetical protein
MMRGKNGSCQVIEAILARLAQVPLSAPLAIVMAVADHSSVTAVKADNVFRPSQLTNNVIALCFVEPVRQRDQVHHGFCSLPQRELPTDQLPDQDQHAEIRPRAGGSLPCRGLFITPKPDKSLDNLSIILGVLVAGAVGGLIGYLIARYLDRRYSERFTRQMQQGGLVLWVNLKSPEQEARAVDILTRYGADHVHVHTLPVHYYPIDSELELDPDTIRRPHPTAWWNP